MIHATGSSFGSELVDPAEITVIVRAAIPATHVPVNVMRIASASVIRLLRLSFPYDRPSIDSLVIFFWRLFAGIDQTIAFKSVRAAACFCAREVRIQGYLRIMPHDVVHVVNLISTAIRGESVEGGDLLRACWREIPLRTICAD